VTVSVIVGDCVESMRALTAGTFQTCVTSPPYYGLRDYGVEGQIGLEDTPDAYIARMVDVFREVRRVLRDDGTCWLNIGDCYAGGSSGDRNPGTVKQGAGFIEKNAGRAAVKGHKPKDLLGIPWMLAFALRADGWYLRSAIVWHKPNPMPESVRDRPTSAYEMVFLLTKRAAYYYDAEAIAEDALTEGDDRAVRTDTRKLADPMCADGGSRARTGKPTGATRNARNVWTIATQPYSGAHFATMPPDLAERCIKAGTSERGQCPHCGKAWERQTAKGEPDREWQRRSGGDANGEYHGKSTKGHAEAGVQDASEVKARILAGMAPTLTTGWSPSCDCPEHVPVPQAVLDPFGGAGTTGLVADRLGRHATLCELNPAYAELARERITADAPLLGAVA
jgi:DNA modification methylase